MLMSFRKSTGAVAAVTLSLLATIAARAADMPIAPLLDDPAEERVTFGTGWYLRGDVAAANDVRLSVGNVSLPTGRGVFNSWSVGVGAGYKYNEWFRTDVTLDYRSPRTFNGNTVAGVPCQDGATPVIVGGVVVGSQPVYLRCYDITKANITSLHVLFNAYVDLGTWYGITPYIGAGVGFNSVHQKASQNYFYANQNAYNPTFTDPYTLGTYSIYLDQSRTSNSIQLAWAGMAGVSYAITPHLAADVGYRYLGLGNVTTFTSFAGKQQKYLTAQELRVGLRYTPD